MPPRICPRSRGHQRNARRTGMRIACTALVLNLPLWGNGCGWSPPSGTIENNVFILPFAPGQPLADALRGTAFDGGQALELNLVTGAFRVRFTDSARALSGFVAPQGSGWEMLRIHFRTGPDWSTLDFNPGTRELIRVQSSDGKAWEAARAPVARVKSGPEQPSDYLAANADLIAAIEGNSGDASLAFFPTLVSFILFVGWFCSGTTIFCPGLPQALAVIAALLAPLPPPVITPVNNPPNARNDAFTTPEDTAVTGNVLANNGSGADDDPDGDALTTTLATNATNGAVALGTDGAFTYTPNTGFVGTDTFTYDLSDGNGGTDTAVVTITITAVNNPPIAQDDDFETDAEDSVTGNLFADNGNGVDSDPDGDTITIIEINGSAANVGAPVALLMSGSVTVNADGTFEYTDGGFGDLVQTFTYTISDGNGGTDTATVTIVVLP